MRLINVNDLALQEFNEKNTPPYAILSHTWEDGQEISYQEMVSPNRGTRKKGGYKKIMNCANEAKDHNLQWIWCDTCCIDKSSSAELSEAINSMYAYYRRAEVCFAFLADVEFSSGFFNSSASLNTEDANRQIQRKLSKSRWFSRGWTLQELIAPQNLHFFSGKWTFLCDKGLIADQISTFTGIPANVLRNGNPLTCSVAQRLSWAATRQTTRVEDISYCLLGLLDVNMPLLYGEGEKAFLRLQEEIIRNSTDQTIFAWEFPDGIDDPLSYVSGVLADSPQKFKSCGEVTEAFDLDDDSEIPAFTMTNLGLNISLPVKTYEYGILSASLSCAKAAKVKQPKTQIYLRKLRNGLYARIPPRTSKSDHLLSAESFQLVITQRFFTSKLVHFHEAYGMNMTSGDFSMKTVLVAPHFQNPYVISNTASKRFRFQRPIPGPEHDEPWVAIVVGDHYLAVVLLGIRLTSRGDMLWAQCVDTSLSRASIGHLGGVEAIAHGKMGEITSNTPRDDLQYGRRYAIPCDYKCCTFQTTQDPKVSRSVRKELRLFAKAEIQDQRLVLQVNLTCLW